MYLNCNGKEIFVIDSLGNIGKLLNGPISIEEIKEEYDPDTVLYPFTDTKEFSFTIDAICINHGILDYVCGFDTPAARRHIRRIKRRKEKERRNRLKYGNSEA